jgi:fatty acid desaturase
MSVAARIDPKQYFTAAEWAPITAHSNWRGIAMVIHAWVVIAAAGAMVVIWPWTLPLAVMIIGTRQLGLSILMHEASHGALHKNLKVNDFVGEWMTTGGLRGYRPYHMTHHRFAQQDEDPDLGLSAPFPITPLSLRRKIIRDLTGQTFFKQRFGRAAARLNARKAGEPLLPIIRSELWSKRRWLAFGLLVTLAGAPFGLWWLWPVLWVLPQATWNPLVTRLRNIAEHACIGVNEPSPMRQARTTKANFLERMFIAPYYVNYHCEHHMFMHVPCYNLPRIHRALHRKGVTEQMLVEPGGYPKILALAASRGR